MSPRRARVTTLASLALVAALGWAAVDAWAGWMVRQAGARLFDGQTPLVAQVQGHDQPLPAAAARCINCHGAQADTPSPARASLSDADTAATGATQGLAPQLSAKLLRDSRSRRGGPPSYYDAASLCHLLRTGIDPAWVLVPRSMPRYQISDSDCARLWAHLAA